MVNLCGGSGVLEDLILLCFGAGVGALLAHGVMTMRIAHLTRYARAQKDAESRDWEWLMRTTAHERPPHGSTSAEAVHDEAGRLVAPAQPVPPAERPSGPWDTNQRNEVRK